MRTMNIKRTTSRMPIRSKSVLTTNMPRVAQRARRLQESTDIETRADQILARWKNFSKEDYFGNQLVGISIKNYDAGTGVDLNDEPGSEELMVEFNYMIDLSDFEDMLYEESWDDDLEDYTYEGTTEGELLYLAKDEIISAIYSTTKEIQKLPQATNVFPLDFENMSDWVKNLKYVGKNGKPIFQGSGAVMFSLA